MACGVDLKAQDRGLHRERVLDRPLIRNQEYLDGGSCREKKSHLILPFGHRNIELFDSKSILLCCLVRALKSWTE